MKKLSILLSVVLVVVMMLSGVAQASYLHTSGNKILKADGTPASMSGLSWFGFETGNYSPHGLWANSMSNLLDIVKASGFNHLRLPYCSQMFDAGSTTNSIDATMNPDLVGLTPTQVMDVLVQRCAEKGIAIYLDRHRPDSGGQSELWYTSAYDETRWINDWKMLASRYKGNDTIVGCDLHNEPHGKATWGTGDTATDWRLAAQRCGNAILGVNPDLLIIVEGIGNYNGNGYWWGGNLMGVQDYPVTLNVANRVVYSPHDYGPGVAEQTWFSDPSFPSNMPGVWDKYWGYISKNNIAPILVGEFGGRSIDTSSVEGKWQNALVNYIKANGLNWSYWCLNPNSGDTGGILSDDWKTVIQGKINMLKPAMYPEIKAPTLVPNASVKIQMLNGSTAASNGSVNPTFRVCNTGNVKINLSDVKIRYYYTINGESAQTFYCDYSPIGSTNITGSFVKMASPVSGADYYLEIGFTSGAGTLAPGAYAELQTRMSKNDYTTYTQTDDYSFNATAKAVVDWDKTTGYISGALKWGTEPSGTAVTPTPTVSATATATPTPTPVADTVPPTPTPSTATATPTPTPSTATATPTPTPSTATPTPSTATATPTPTPSTATPTPTPTAGTPTPGGIKVQFFNGNTAATTNTIYPNFKVVNTGTAAINLSDVKVRYYFTNDGTQANSFACDFSTAGSGNVTSSFATIAKTNADRYLEIGFTSGAGTLGAGASTEVKGRLWKSDWSNFTQTNDYSYNATATNYADSAKTTGYIAGALKWGTEP